MKLDVATEIENCIPEQMSGNSVSSWQVIFKDPRPYLVREIVIQSSKHSGSLENTTEE